MSTHDLLGGKVQLFKRDRSKIPADTVGITVSDGWITLEGAVEWYHQKSAAEDAVKSLNGVKGVSNLIAIQPKLNSADIKSSIKSAFERHALFDSNKVTVEISGNNVTLRGKVRNHMESKEAEHSAWNAPGIGSVDNKISVEWGWFGS